MSLSDCNIKTHTVYPEILHDPSYGWIARLYDVNGNIVEEDFGDEEDRETAKSQAWDFINSVKDKYIREDVE